MIELKKTRSVGKYCPNPFKRYGKSVDKDVDGNDLKGNEIKVSEQKETMITVKYDRKLFKLVDWE